MSSAVEVEVVAAVDFIRTEVNLAVKEPLLQSILFEVKHEIPQDGSVLSNLPFYWDKDGPTSDKISSAIHQKKPESFATSLSSEIVINALERVSSNVNDNGFCHFVQYIFQKYAPYEFMPTFKNGFLYNLRRFLNQANPYAAQADALERIRGLAVKSLIEVPRIGIFSWFNGLFSDYVTTAIRAIDYCDKRELDASLLQQVYDAGDSIWNTFSSGARILKSCHDPYYDSNLKLWYQDFLLRLEDAESPIAYVKGQVLDIVRYDYLPCNLSARQKEVVSTVVHGYLSNAQRQGND